MFDRDFLFKGSHATKVKFLCKDRNGETESGANVFDRFLDVYMLAPIMGMLYGERAEVDNNSADTARIFAEAMIREQSKLKYIYRLILICDESSELIEQERINRTFRGDTNKDILEKNMQTFHSYVLGGIDVLYRKFTEDNTTKDDYLNSIYNLVENFKNDLEA